MKGVMLKIIQMDNLSRTRKVIFRTPLSNVDSVQTLEPYEDGGRKGTIEISFRRSDLISQKFRKESGKTLWIEFYTSRK